MGRRRIRAIAIGIMLLLIVVIILAFVDATAMIEDSKRCWKLQWPRYIGCAMAAHEGLAAGLIGAAGAIWAAWLAFTAIREQLAAEQEERRTEVALRHQQQIEAKRVAVTALSRAVHSAGAALFIVKRGLARDESTQREIERSFFEGGSPDLIKQALDSFVIRDIARELAIEDRIRFLQIVETLATFVSVCKASPPSVQGRAGQRLEAWRTALTGLSVFLAPFSEQLAEVFSRYSERGSSAPESLTG